MLTRSRANRANNQQSIEGDDNIPSILEMDDNQSNASLIDPNAVTRVGNEALRIERERIARQRVEWDAVRARMSQELSELRETQERQALEILRLREENEQLRSNSRVSEEGNGNAHMLNGLVRGINSMNISIKPPRFGNDVLANPNEFIENVEKYFLVKKVPDDCKLLVLETLLEGRARDWYRAQSATYTDFTAFKDGFLAEFYSIPTQVRLKAQWSARRHNPSDGPLQSYFLRQASAAQYFTPKLDQYEINYSVVQQLPMRARDALVTIDYADTNVVARALAQLDASYEENRNRESRRPLANNNNSSFNGSFNSSGSSGGSRYSHSSPNHSGNNNNSFQNNSRVHPNHAQDSSYRARGLDVAAPSWYPLPDVSVPPPIYVDGGYNYTQPDNPNVNNTKQSDPLN